MTLQDLYDVHSSVCSYEDVYTLVGSVYPRLHEMDTLLEHEVIQSVEDFLKEGREITNESTYRRLKIEWAASPLLLSAIEWEYDSVDDCHSSPM